MKNKSCPVCTKGEMEEGFIISVHSVLWSKKPRRWFFYNREDIVIAPLNFPSSKQHSVHCKSCDAIITFPSGDKRGKLKIFPGDS